MCRKGSKGANQVDVTGADVTGRPRCSLEAAPAFALEQALLYTPTVDAICLGRTCRLLQAFLAAAHAVGAFWFLPSGAARGSYDGRTAWLHALADCASVSSFLEAARRVKVASRLDFYSSTMLNACTSLLWSEGAGEFDFAVAWKFEPRRVRKFLNDDCGQPLVSEALQFQCSHDSHDLVFGVTLSLSRSSQSASTLEIALSSLDVVGGEMPEGVELRVSGALPAVRALGYMQANLLPLLRRRGARAPGCRPDPIRLWLDDGRCEDMMRHNQLIAFLNVDVDGKPAQGSASGSLPSSPRKAEVRALVA